MNQLQTEDEDWKRADRFIKVTFLNDGRDWRLPSKAHSLRFCSRTFVADREKH